MTEDSVELKDALLALHNGDPDIEAMKSRFEKFNIFKAIGMGSLEIRHSNFLAFLLDPLKSHGLGDSFVRQLLVDVLTKNPDGSPLKASELENWPLSGLEVQREADSIDILLTDHEHRFVVVIENKTQSGEHSDQLRRYRRTIENQFPDYRRLFLYLSPDADDEGPSDPAFIPTTYRSIEQAVLRVLDITPAANPDLVSLLKNHYLPMLRMENLVPDQELEDLVDRIYRRHRLAIDYICKNRFSLAPIEELVRNHSSLMLIRTERKRMAFVPVAWKGHALDSGKNVRFGWKLHFQFRDEGRRLRLVLYLRPAQDDFGKKLIAAAKEAGNPFTVPKKSDQQRVLLYSLWITRVNVEELSAADEGIQRAWTKFIADDLPQMRQVISRALNE